MYRAGLDVFTTCPECFKHSTSFTGRHNALVHIANEHVLLFCAVCGYVRTPTYPASFPGDPAQYRALWALLQE
jgi:transcription elongation factor Elf1